VVTPKKKGIKMIRHLIYTLLPLLLTFNVSAKEIDKTQPYEMMKQVSEQTFARLKDPNYLKVVVEEEMMPYVNEKYAALKLLGSNLKGAKRADVGEFIQAFRGYLVTSYAQALTQYSDQKIEFGPMPKVEDGKSITKIKVNIIDSPRPNIQLEFKLRRNKKTGEWKAFDLIAEGVSLLDSKQSEWSTKIRQDGILSVAKDLEKLATTPIRFESKNQ
jgi:phospholipid transport system substrate-binding protein